MTLHLFLTFTLYKVIQKGPKTDELYRQQFRDKYGDEKEEIKKKSSIFWKTPVIVSSLGLDKN